MTRQELAQYSAHTGAAPRHTGRRTSRRHMAFGLATAAVVMAAVFGAYPLLDRADSPVVQRVDNSADAGAGSAAHSAGATGVAGGEILDGAATLDDDLPAITGLDPDLHAAVAQAAADAAEDDIDFWVTSGWRSLAYQQQLLDEAVREYGSLEAARRWVSTPQLSAHVTGEAVDIGPTEADYWLIQHGTDYGLCQVYSNEIWHFELLTEPGGTCPPMKDGAGG